MAQDVVRLQVPVESLFDSLAELSLTEKHQLWTWLGEQIAAAKLREAQADYQVQNDLNAPTSLTQLEILQELKKLPPVERLAILETALHTLHEDLRQLEIQSTPTERQQQLAAAAKLLLPDYTTDDELTIFTALDSEDFRE
ncbi:MAG: hypothetical protein HYR94_24805 [Chloroflexi bacterium]|nr:hypothetical protein [Chloroflexota bacterium]